MNEQWINDLRAETVDTDPRPGFKDELRATLIAEQHGVTTSTQSASTGHRRFWLLGAAAACVVLLIGGLVLVNGADKSVTPSTVPESSTAITSATVPSTTIETSPSTIPTDSPPTLLPVAPELVVTDPQAISLDEWIDLAALPSLAPDIVTIDRQTLPEGWSVSDEDGRLLVYPTAISDTNGYTYTAAVTTDDQATFDVTFLRDPLSGDPCFLPLGGFPGTVGDLAGATVGDAVCGLTDSGYGLAVVPTDSPDHFSRWTALDVAKAVSFVEADEVPHPDLTAVVGDEEPGVVDFAGTLTGARWAVTVKPSGTRLTDLYVAGKYLSGMELSQEGLNVGQPIPTIESNLTSVPGYGAVAYGHVAGDAVAVIITLDDERTAMLPTLTVDGRSAFAVPIPDSVNVATLTFVAADGSALLAVDVPDVPLGYGGGFLSIMSPR